MASEKRFRQREIWTKEEIWQGLCEERLYVLAQLDHLTKTIRRLEKDREILEAAKVELDQKIEEARNVI